MQIKTGDRHSKNPRLLWTTVSPFCLALGWRGGCMFWVILGLLPSPPLCSNQLQAIQSNEAPSPSSSPFFEDSAAEFQLPRKRSLIISWWWPREGAYGKWEGRRPYHTWAASSAQRGGEPAGVEGKGSLNPAPPPTPSPREYFVC